MECEWETVPLLWNSTISMILSDFQATFQDFNDRRSSAAFLRQLNFLCIFIWTHRDRALIVIIQLYSSSGSKEKLKSAKQDNSNTHTHASNVVSYWQAKCKLLLLLLPPPPPPPTLLLLQMSWIRVLPSHSCGGTLQKSRFNNCCTAQCRRLLTIGVDGATSARHLHLLFSVQRSNWYYRNLNKFL